MATNVGEILDRYGLKQQDLIGECSREIRIKMSLMLTDWKVFGHLLLVSKETLASIDSGNQTEDQKKIALLDSWHEMEGKNATSFKLAEKLYEHKRADLVDHLCKLIHKPATSLEPQSGLSDSKLDVDTQEDISTVTKISQKNVCDEAEISYHSSSLEIPNPCVDISKLSADDKEDLMAQINSLKHEIHVKFLKLQADLIKSLKRLITPAQLVQTLKAHTCSMTDSTENISSATLFWDHEEELMAAKEIEDIFIVINPYFSYFNYELIEVIINVHGDFQDKENMQQYRNDFSEYCKKMPCVEVHEECTCNESKRTKIKFKLDYDRNQLKVDDISRIKFRIAKILNLKPSVLYLHRIEDGCMVITFLIPTFFASSFLDLITINKLSLQKAVKLLFVECDHQDSTTLSLRKNHEHDRSGLDLESLKLPFVEHDHLNSSVEMAGQEQQQQGDKKIGFKTIILFKDQTLGIGSYGAVCKAKCDDLLCAAKIIHPTLFNPTAQHQIEPHREHRLPIRRFEQECEFLSTVRHPNIVQYLGIHQDPETRLPVLLMELMDNSLTHFLESSTQPIPYHIQVNICHDITLALSFLHSNGIIHRDLSGKNVLLIGNIRAKLADFGMARLGDFNLHETRDTLCPGADVYMPPEAVQEKPVYTEKIDCFSFGVITVQALTREFPKPENRMTTVDDPRYPPGALNLRVPEVERRQNHISQVDPNHPLLPIALDCLKDADSERPSAQQLYERVAALKEMANYKDASERVEDSSGKDGEYEQLRHVIDQKDAIIAEKEQQLRQYREELSQQIQQQNQQIQQLERDKQQVEQEKNQAIQEKHQAIQEKKRQLGRVNQQLEESEQLIADFGKRNSELEEQLSVLRNQAQSQGGGAKARAIAVGRTNLKLRWREGEKAPCEMSRYSDAAVDNNTVYCKYKDSDNKIYAYHIPSSYWTPIPDCPLNDGFAIAVIDGLLTTVGGWGFDDKNTNKLFSLTGEGSGRRWTEKFPPMPTKRIYMSVLCTGTAVIVAGGAIVRDQYLKTVEVLNTETRKWHTAPDLPEPLSESSLTLCGDIVYLLGGFDKDKTRTNSVYSCSLSSLLSPSRSKSLEGCRVNTLIRSIEGSPWNKIADLPENQKRSTAVSLCGKLLAIGGMEDSNNKPTTAVRMYQPTTNSWKVILDHMSTPRYCCLAAVLPDNQLMVVGGRNTTNKDLMCDSVEFGRVV